jgi:hypothetical protein
MAYPLSFIAASVLWRNQDLLTQYTKAGAPNLFENVFENPFEKRHLNSPEIKWQSGKDRQGVVIGVWNFNPTSMDAGQPEIFCGGGVPEKSTPVQYNTQQRRPTAPCQTPYLR